MFQHAIHAHYCYLFQMFRIYQKKKSRIELNFRIQSAQCYYDFRPVSYFSERWLYTGYEYELRELRNISKFSPRIDRIFFPGKHLIHFLVLKMKNFRNFVLDNCILDFDAEQVYLKPQVINLKNKEVTVNPKPQTLEKKWFFENPIP